MHLWPKPWEKAITVIGDKLIDAFNQVRLLSI
jgi:hypothetical protein